MIREQFSIDGRECTVHGTGRAEFLLIQPVDDHDLAGLERETEMISAEAGASFLLAAHKIRDWNHELSPWPGPSVFGSEDFGDGAAETLSFVRDKLICYATRNFEIISGTPIILGGYSLAGFFALWSAYQTDTFSGIAAVSPSVWFPGWITYAEAHRPHAEYIYLSLGNKEEKARNPVMATVGRCIRSQQELLTKAGIANDLEWNEGNHFRDPDLRTAKGFVRCIRHLKKG